MEIDLKQIDTVVISHDHWDHIGGLWDLLLKRKNIKVYGCPGFSKKFKDKVRDSQGVLIETSGFQEISKHIFLTDEISGEHKGKPLTEHALITKTPKGLSILTGCAHPGIIKIIKKVSGYFPQIPISLVMGGFHLNSFSNPEIKKMVQEFIELGITTVGPTHCTGDRAIKLFQNEYQDNFIHIKVGQELNL